MVEPKQERALRTRNRLVRAAAEEFDAHGFAGSNVSGIVKRAGMTLGAMYFHFPSKEALALEVMNSQSAVVEPLLDSEGLQRLVDITLVWSHVLRVDPLLRAGVRLAVEQGGFGLRDETSFAGWKATMTEVLETARRRGELLEGVVPADVAEFVVGACTGTQLYSHLAADRADLTERIVRMWRYLLPGIAVPEAAAAIDLDPRRGKED
ncbi:ScbR family autoregulator-binding transcription factor [Streptomyces sp. ODS28]|uniref:ScbR family autoregulator-binding transcription factor n=1 Tax=Streptomyces sp. ODS28 TaxID=3136688 RepID=UPI0031E96235